MGVRSTFHFGPYLKCTYIPMPRTKTLRFCPNGDHISPTPVFGMPVQELPFCGQCGAKIETKEVVTSEFTSDVDTESLCEEINEDFYEANVTDADQAGRASADYWLLNKQSSIERETTIHQYETGVIEITPAMMESEVKTIEREFAKQLTIFRKYYQQVRVVWGVIATCG